MILIFLAVHEDNTCLPCLASDHVIGLTLDKDMWTEVICYPFRKDFKTWCIFSACFLQKTTDIIMIILYQQIEVLNLVYQYLWDTRTPKERVTHRSWRCPGRGHGNPLEYFCLGYPMDRGGYSPQDSKESDMTEAT